MEIEERIERLAATSADLRADLEVLRDLLGRDRGLCLNKARVLAEQVLVRLCRRDGVSWGPREPTIENMVGPLAARGALPKNLLMHVRGLQTYASPGSHYQEAGLSDAHVRLAVLALLELLEWHHGLASGQDPPAAGGAGGDVAALPRFVGRDAEVATVLSALSTHRLVTLVGVGGIGKTRLALEAATRSRPHVVVPLEGCADSTEDAAVACLQALGVATRGGEPASATVERALAGRDVLLLLDNAETAPSASAWVGRLLAKCPGLRILATSQQPLDVEGEQRVPVGPMPAPNSKVRGADALEMLDSYRLFLDRARLRRPGWEPTAAEREALSRVLSATDGVPLAVVLVAAWADAVSPAELADGLVAARRRYLGEAGPTGSAPRHRSLSASFAWVWDHLDSRVREDAAGLSVFEGGFRIAAAEAVLGTSDALGSVRALVDHALLARREEDGASRYEMLECVRSAFAERLDPEKRTALLAAHERWFLRELKGAEAELDGVRPAEGVARWRADAANFRRGWRTAEAAGDAATALEWVVPLSKMLGHTGHGGERLGIAERAREIVRATSNPTDVARAEALVGFAHLNFPAADRTSHIEDAIRCFERALAGFTPRTALRSWAIVMNNLGTALQMMPVGDAEANVRRAIACHEAVLSEVPETVDPRQRCFARTLLGNALQRRVGGDRAENIERAIECYESALREGSEAAAPRDWADVQENLGVAFLHRVRGDRAENLRRAVRCFEAVLRVRTEAAFPLARASTQSNMGIALRLLPSGDRSENIARARESFEAALRALDERESPILWANVQHNLGLLFLESPGEDRADALARAIAHFHAALRVRTEGASPRDWALTQHCLARAHEALGTEEARAVAADCLAAAVRGFRRVGDEAGAAESEADLARLRPT